MRREFALMSTVIGPLERAGQFTCTAVGFLRDGIRAGPSRSHVTEMMRSDTIDGMLRTAAGPLG